MALLGRTLVSFWTGPEAVTMLTVRFRGLWLPVSIGIMIGMRLQTFGMTFLLLIVTGGNGVVIATASAEAVLMLVPPWTWQCSILMLLKKAADGWQAMCLLGANDMALPVVLLIVTRASMLVVGLALPVSMLTAIGAVNGAAVSLGPVIGGLLIMAILTWFLVLRLVLPWTWHAKWLMFVKFGCGAQAI